MEENKDMNTPVEAMKTQIFAKAHKRATGRVLPGSA
jgi:hypothetical protein